MEPGNCKGSIDPQWVEEGEKHEHWRGSCSFGEGKGKKGQTSLLRKKKRGGGGRNPSLMNGQGGGGGGKSLVHRCAVVVRPGHCEFGGKKKEALSSKGQKLVEQRGEGRVKKQAVNPHLGKGYQYFS